MNLGIIGTKLMAASTATKTTLAITALILTEVALVTMIKMADESPAPATATEIPVDYQPFDVEPEATLMPGSTDVTTEAGPAEPGAQVDETEMTARADAEPAEPAEATEVTEVTEEPSGEIFDDGIQESQIASAEEMVILPSQTEDRSPFKPPE